MPSPVATDVQAPADIGVGIAIGIDRSCSDNKHGSPVADLLRRERGIPLLFPPSREVEDADLDGGRGALVQEFLL